MAEVPLSRDFPGQLLGQVKGWELGHGVTSQVPIFQAPGGQMYRSSETAWHGLVQEGGPRAWGHKAVANQ